MTETFPSLFLFLCLQVHIEKYLWIICLFPIYI